MFGIRWEHIAEMPRRELDQYLSALERAADAGHEDVT